MDHGGRRSGAEGPAAGRPWRGGVAAPAPAPAPAQPPPKVYRVEPRDFRELVQRLTGAGAPGPAANAATGPAAFAFPAQQRGVLRPAVAAAESWRAGAAAAGPVEPDPVPWYYDAPLLSPAAYGAPGFDGNPGSGALL